MCNVIEMRNYFFSGKTRDCGEFIHNLNNTFLISFFFFFYMFYLL